MEEGFAAVQLDYADEASIATAADAVLAATGGTLDALFNNGGYAQPGAIEDLDTALLRAQFEATSFVLYELGPDGVWHTIRTFDLVGRDHLG